MPKLTELEEKIKGPRSSQSYVKTTFLWFNKQLKFHVTQNTGSSNLFMWHRKQTESECWLCYFLSVFTKESHLTSINLRLPVVKWEG